MKFKFREDLILGIFFVFISLNLLIDNVNCDLSKPLMLTPYVGNGDFETAKRVSEVDASYFFDVKSHAGFITVDGELNSNIWFWYFPVKDGTQDAPLVIRLVGGPGYPSLFGIFEGAGPFLYKGYTLTNNPNSWHLNHSVLFIDSPMGIGFSFTDNNENYYSNHTQITTHLYKFLQQFYQIFPELQPVPMFLSGESYAGIYIPNLANEIHNRNPTEKTKINLKGMAIGNGWIDGPNLYEMSSIAYHAGLIDSRQQIVMKIMENRVRKAIEQEKWELAFNKRTDAMLYIRNVTGLRGFYNYIDDELFVDEPPYKEVMNADFLKEVFHVGNISYNLMSLTGFNVLMGENMKSAMPIVEKVLEHYPMMMYSGQLDLIVPYVNLERAYDRLKWTGANEFRTTKRKPWYHGSKVVGYEKRVGNLHEIMFCDAGHSVAMEKPDLLIMKITEFINANSQLYKSNENKNVPENESKNAQHPDEMDNRPK